MSRNGVSRRSVITPRLVFGLGLIFFGAVLTLDHMDVVRAAEILRFWMVILIVAGLAKLVWPGSPGGRVTGFLLVFFGTWLLLYETYVIHLDPWDFTPLILVVIGLRIVGRSLFRPSADGGTVNGLAILGGARRTSHSADFRGGDVAAFLGGCEVDLRRAGISRSPAEIDAYAFWGGVEIKVPRDWTVVVQGVPLLGSYDDKTDEPEAESPGGRQELVVGGFAVMGGVEISN